MNIKDSVSEIYESDMVTYILVGMLLVTVLLGAVKIVFL